MKRPTPPLHPIAPLIISAHEAQVIAALRKYEMVSRTDIARLTGWSRPKVTGEVGKLMKRGVLMDVGEGQSQGGRRPRLLKFNNVLGYVVGVDMGAGIMCNGRIHRGSNGCAGDIGHISADRNGPICRCGNPGCVEMMAAGPAIANRAWEAAHNGSSQMLAQKLKVSGGALRAEDVAAAVRQGDQASIEIIQSSGQMIGDVLAGLVNFFNPSLILVGGGVSNIGNQLLASIRQAVLRRSTALATRELNIRYSPMGTEAGVTGAIHLALEHLFVVPDKTTK